MMIVIYTIFIIRRLDTSVKLKPPHCGIFSRVSCVSVTLLRAQHNAMNSWRVLTKPNGGFKDND